MEIVCGGFKKILSKSTNSWKVDTAKKLAFALIISGTSPHSVSSWLFSWAILSDSSEYFLSWILSSTSFNQTSKDGPFHFKSFLPTSNSSRQAKGAIVTIGLIMDDWSGRLLSSLAMMLKRIYIYIYIY